MEPVEPDGAPFVPNDEVDGLAWLPVAAARTRLSYGHDAAVLDALEGLDPGAG
jgi:8-oxo-dGTP diphosphatase